MSNHSLLLEDVGKSYRFFDDEWTRVASWFGMSNNDIKEKWVLKNINFSVEKGESIGIVGQNGAGKSTLLKIVTGTIRPTTGIVLRNGKISAILELGIGFNPDFTGRQNSRNSLGLLGFSEKEISDVMPFIESFAEIGDYFDQPVRSYSSGMQVRVAFSVVTAIRPDILIVDEALSVGDAAFQRKCFRRIEDFCSQGTTLLYVSHSTESVKKICKKAIFLKNGEISAIGKSKNVCDEYECFLFGGAKRKQKTAIQNTLRSSILDKDLLTDCEVSYGTGEAQIENIWLSNENGGNINVISSGQDFYVNYRVKFNEQLINPIFAMMIKTREGIAIYGTDSTWQNKPTGVFEVNETKLISFHIKNRLAPGTYYLNCGIRNDSGEKTEFFHRRVDALIFRIASTSNTTVGSGIVELDSTLSIQDDVYEE